MDESPKQLIAETINPPLCSPGNSSMYDSEYKRCRMCNIFLACDHLQEKEWYKLKEEKLILNFY